MNAFDQAFRLIHARKGGDATWGDELQRITVEIHAIEDVDAREAAWLNLAVALTRIASSAVTVAATTSVMDQETILMTVLDAIDQDAHDG